jgi:hypothetical protein
MYELIEWPEIQELMDEEGFDKNACLANDEEFLDNQTSNPSSAYFVSVEWLNEIR